MKIFESVARDEGGIAMLYVAEMYYSERYYKYKKTIFEWCFKAADWGHKSAQSLKNIVYNEKNTKPILYNDDIQTYGGTFIFSEEIDKNHEAVQKFLEKVAEKGSGEALYKLGLMYRFGKHKNLKKAEEYFLQAVEKENVSAMNSLGEMYHVGGNRKFPFIDTIEEGPPFEKNIKKAIEYYTKAAESGDYKEAYYNIGDIYLTDVQDPNKAIEYYTKAAEMGCLGSMERLCFIYSGYCKGVEKNIKEAKWWGEKAVTGGSKEAKKLLKEIENNN